MGTYDPSWNSSAPDEGELALSIIFYQVGELRALEIETMNEAPERLEAIHDAARLLRAYISGLKARND